MTSKKSFLFRISLLFSLQRGNSVASPTNAILNGRMTMAPPIRFDEDGVSFAWESATAVHGTNEHRVTRDEFSRPRLAQLLADAKERKKEVRSVRLHPLQVILLPPAHRRCELVGSVPGEGPGAFHIEAVQGEG